MGCTRRRPRSIGGHGLWGKMWCIPAPDLVRRNGVRRNQVLCLSIPGGLSFAIVFWTGVLTIVINFIMSSLFAAILIYAMELLPGRVGLVGGFLYGLTFGLGEIGVALLGGLADHYGTETVCGLCSFLLVIGLLA